ncbi:hypothetical protein RFI_05945 [Reticulomyxa filosa]|uniref:Uncharacterized protein n=1 Tax=Reticulomyxa filosa TaxID=46433 RepID=X6P0V9_RETFI|nr:hypothetical protein RFI_05945 [Reticulomyxa filosa]|eukprot:ETO31172.1 hypothetical protein RFI_05945 [Reticulomyxa filosa]
MYIFFYGGGLVDSEMGIVSLKFYLIGLLLFCVLNIIFFRDILVQLSKDSDVFAFYQLGTVVPIEEKPETETMSPPQITQLLRRTKDDQNNTQRVVPQQLQPSCGLPKSLLAREKVNYGLWHIAVKKKKFPPFFFFLTYKKKIYKNIFKCKLTETPEQLMKKFETTRSNNISRYDYYRYLRYRLELEMCSRTYFLANFRLFVRTATRRGSNPMDGQLGNDSPEDSRQFPYQMQARHPRTKRLSRTRWNSNGTRYDGAINDNHKQGAQRFQQQVRPRSLYKQSPLNNSQSSRQLLHFNFKYVIY